MAGRSSLMITAGCVVLLTLPAPAFVADSATEHLDRAVQLLLPRDPTGQDLRAGFLSLLDALIATAPDAPSAARCGPRLATARQVASRGSILDDRAVALLHECFRDTHDGASFRVPHSIRSVADAAGYCRAQLQSARDALQNGRGDAAFGRMIEAAVLIVTPIDRDAGRGEAWIWEIGRQWWAAVQMFVQEGLGWLSTARSSSRG